MHSNNAQNNDLRDIKRNWEGLAMTRPFWAICHGISGKRKEDIRAFFESGEREIGIILNYIKNLGLYINLEGHALDFGCGIGRLTQALTKYFSYCHGVDISSGMVDLANKFNKYPSKCHYYINDSADLQIFQNNFFDFIYSSIVLQHIPKEVIKNYLEEFVRVLKPKVGILIFQVPHHYQLNGIASLRARLAIRTRLKKIFGIHKESNQKESYRIEMHYMPEETVRHIIEAQGGRIIDVKITNSMDYDFNGNLKYLEREPRDGNVSKQYCVTKAE